MAIPSEIIAQFDRGVRERGRQSFLGGAVNIIKADQRDIKAEVQGTQLYEIDIEFAKDDTEFYCTCPYAREWGGPCKHAWATLLAADELGMLPTEEDEELNDKPMTLAPPRRLSPITAAPIWKTTLARLRKTSIERGHTLSHPHAKPFPSDRRIVYVIDLLQTQERRRGVVVEVMTQKRQREGVWDRPKKWTLEEAQWLNAPDDADRLIALMLMGAQNSMYYSGGSALFTIPSTRFESLLRRICETGRCGARYVAKQEDFVPLEWDGNGAWEFCIELVRAAGRKIRRRQRRLMQGRTKSARGSTDGDFGRWVDDLGFEHFDA